MNSESSTIKPRLLILDGMQGVVSAEDVGGVDKVNGTYKDPFSDSFWTVKESGACKVTVVNTRPGSVGSEVECWICWSCSGLAKDVFFADTKGISIPFKWKV